MQMKLELVPIPVADVDRAKAFYTEQLGFVADVEAARAELVGRGVDVGPVHDVGGGVRYAGFADPDGNGLELQEMAWRSGDAY